MAYVSGEMGQGNADFFMLIRKAGETLMNCLLLEFSTHVFELWVTAGDKPQKVKPGRRGNHCAVGVISGFTVLKNLWLLFWCMEPELLILEALMRWMSDAFLNYLLFSLT